MNKAKQFIDKHGYSYKSYAIALIIFPPACFLIAWKIDNIDTAIRVLLTIIAIMIPPAIIFLIGFAITNIFN